MKTLLATFMLFIALLVGAVAGDLENVGRDNLKVRTGSLTIGNITITSGTASPVNSVSKPPGTFYAVVASGTCTLFYKATGTGTTGWLQLTGT